jgi:phage terminase large subunit-like protein
LDYANQVVLDEIPVCSYVRQAVQRFFDDMGRDDIHLDWQAAERVMNFVQRMPHIKGPLAGQPLQLDLWQKFIYLNIFGWKVGATGTRRFRRAYTEVPRGNGKSSMVAPAGLYMLSADREGGAEVYSAAVTRDQAKIVFNVAKAMATRADRFMSRAGVEVLQHVIMQERSESTFQPLSADARSLDGLNVHLAILDELAQHKTREVYDVLETATGKRSQALMWMITTAGPDQGGIGFEVHDYAIKVLAGVLQDDSFFGIIYTIDGDDDWTRPAAWIKANPNWGTSVQPDVIAQLAHKAFQLPSAQNSFKMKHLNIWTNANSMWLNSESWARQALLIKEEEFAGEECHIGLDLASKIDVVAAVKMFRREVNGVYHYFIKPRLYLPEQAILENRNANYRGWVAGGHLIATPGDVIDFSMIEEDIIEDNKKFDVREIPYDPWQATQMAQRLEKESFRVIEFPATVRNFSEPMKEFESLVRQGRLWHDDNPAFNWMISNLVVREDRKGNIFPRKERDENKIDGPVAAIMALARWMFAVQEEEQQFEIGGFIG